MMFFDIGTRTLQQKNFANWDDTETTDLFSSATSWADIRGSHIAATLSISEDVTTAIYIFNALITYIFINLS